MAGRYYNRDVKRIFGAGRAAKRGFKPIRVLPIGYLTIIIIGALLLMLPAASLEAPLSAFEALFTSVSASCVTGLIVVDTGTRFTLFGQIVIISLIQLGGLGFMTLATLLFGAAGRRISLRNRMTAAEALGEDGLSDMVDLCARAAKYTFAIEGAGALLLSFRFVGEMGFIKGVWYSVFHSISAFCNAGFDLIGGYRSLVPYYDDPLVCLTVSALVIAGGLGFVVLSELRSKRQPCGLSLHTKIVLTASAAALLLGFVLTLALEWSNPKTLGPMGFFEKLLSALFQSVTLRTAGFNTIDQAGLTDASKLISSVLMLIGGAPAGTAGGIKVTTVAVLILTVRAFLHGQRDTEAFGRRLSEAAIRRALVLSFIGMAAAIVSTGALSLLEGGAFSLVDCLYECTSALGTVGLSNGFTGLCTAASRVILMILMFTGRAGILTLALAVGGKTEAQCVRYPEGGVMIG